jgi:hypothetical protein
VPRRPRYSRSGNRLSRYFSRKNRDFASIHAFFRRGFLGATSERCVA